MLNYLINAGAIYVLFTFSHKFHDKVCTKHFDKKFSPAKNLGAKRKRKYLFRFWFQTEIKVLTMETLTPAQSSSHGPAAHTLHMLQGECESHFIGNPFGLFNCSGLPMKPTPLPDSFRNA